MSFLHELFHASVISSRVRNLHVSVHRINFNIQDFLLLLLWGCGESKGGQGHYHVGVRGGMHHRHYDL